MSTVVAPQPVKPYPPNLKIGKVSPIDAGPITRFDGLADDQSPRDLRYRVPIIYNPFLRVVIFLALNVACQLVAGLLMALVMGPQNINAGVSGPIAMIVCTVTAYLLWVLTIERRRPPLELAPHRWIGLLIGLGVGAVAFTVCYAVIWVLGGFDLTVAPSVNWGEWWFTVLTVGAVAGITEEIIFRGLLLRVTEEFLGTWGAVTLSGLVFGLVHLSNPDATWQGAIGIALEAGLFFGVLYALTRSLWVVMGVHAAWNIVQGPILGVIVSGTGQQPSILVSHAKGSDLISGGIFGAEASFVTVVIMLAVAVYLGVRLQRGGGVVAPMWVRRKRQKLAMEAAAEPPAPVEAVEAVEAVAADRLTAEPITEPERPLQP